MFTRLYSETFSDRFNEEPILEKRPELMIFLFKIREGSESGETCVLISFTDLFPKSTENNNGSFMV